MLDILSPHGSVDRLNHIRDAAHHPLVNNVSVRAADMLSIAGLFNEILTD